MTARTALIDRYLDAIESSDREALLSVLHPEVRVVLHPNLFAPTGSESQLAALSRSFEVGRGLLRWQRFGRRTYDELGPNRVLARMVWTGETDRELPGMPPGTELKAAVASLLTFEDGRIVRQENWDCYFPPVLPAADA